MLSWINSGIFGDIDEYHRTIVKKIGYRVGGEPAILIPDTHGETAIAGGFKTEG